MAMQISTLGAIIREFSAACKLADDSIGNGGGIGAKLDSIGVEGLRPFFIDPETGNPRTDLGDLTPEKIFAAKEILQQAVMILAANRQPLLECIL